MTIHTSSNNDAASDRLLTFPELRERYGTPYTRGHLYWLEARGLFPKRRKVGPRRIAWSEAEVRAWVQSRPAAPSAGARGRA